MAGGRSSSRSSPSRKQSRPQSAQTQRSAADGSRSRGSSKTLSRPQSAFAVRIDAARQAGQNGGTIGSRGQKQQPNMVALPKKTAKILAQLAKAPTPSRTRQHLLGQYVGRVSMENLEIAGYGRCPPPGAVPSTTPPARMRPSSAPILRGGRSSGEGGFAGGLQGSSSSSSSLAPSRTVQRRPSEQPSAGAVYREAVDNTLDRLLSTMECTWDPALNGTTVDDLGWHQKRSDYVERIFEWHNGHSSRPAVHAHSTKPQHYLTYDVEDFVMPGSLRPNPSWLEVPCWERARRATIQHNRAAAARAAAAAADADAIAARTQSEYLFSTLPTTIAGTTQSSVLAMTAS
mmetsp:Transcript_57601/g.136957  ORF Transcript_57601/g.136957 Transcript_57601/m.136957 type:complete len:345 (-) Transcript_57601:16-1050(-)